MKFPTVDEYIASIKPKKQAAYRRGYDKFIRTNNLTAHYELMQKPNEVSIGTDDHMKSRNLFNPTDSVKVMAGYLNKVFIMIDKVLTREFIHGMNTGKLEECMQQDIPMF
jgi:hypothetical protein